MFKPQRSYIEVVMAKVDLAFTEVELTEERRDFLSQVFQFTDFNIATSPPDQNMRCLC